MYCCSLKLSSRKAIAGLLAITFGFAVGIACYTAISRLTAKRQAVAMSPYERRVEEWHRLYEAAWMTNDSAIMKQVRERMMCVNNVGESLAMYIDTGNQVGCLKKHAAPPETIFGPGSEYGNFSAMILDTHTEWAAKNQEFFQTVSSPAKAKKYFLEHWPK